MQALQTGDPDRVGRYRLVGRLGSGGMGRVYLGRSPGGRTVAVKVVHPQFAADPVFRRRFAGEVAAARRVSGAFTAPVVDADHEAEFPWLVTAYVPGPALGEVVTARGPLPEASVRVLAAGLAEALVEIHRCGLIHRDLTPGNVLLADDGPRVIDFGIARAADSVQVTATGTMIGTPGFMSPEQLAGEELTPAADVFSLGAVLTYAATGEGPFGAPTLPALIARVLTAEPVLDAVPEGLRPLLAACLAREPAARPSPGRVLDLLGDTDPLDGAGGWLPADVTAVVAERGAEVRELAATADAARAVGGTAPRPAAAPLPAGPRTPPPGDAGTGPQGTRVAPAPPLPPGHPSGPRPPAAYSTAPGPPRTGPWLPPVDPRRHRPNTWLLIIPVLQLPLGVGLALTLALGAFYLAETDYADLGTEVYRWLGGSGDMETITDMDARTFFGRALGLGYFAYNNSLALGLLRPSLAARYWWGAAHAAAIIALTNTALVAFGFFS
ncbi:serine/threonine-protein kinase [Allonocardiopsis opalescens]|uniref:Serine/threonine protein kinase n=1 Tax=Allonocardiopsis opalescens TaxID=1144618 RepID=A0A2T0PWX8_9ACTN|nr:serine/threonine-protein kinase [Allonocardiopsis opalescens]PRX96035.1 serine/threonine protein kinase [Allonocardiopsis opalescens]